MKRKLLLIVFLSLFFTSLNALSGPLAGEKNIRLVKTQWFDIIYPERCQNSAKLLYENADQLYYKVTEQYGLSPAFRMPLVICPGVENFNAFWSILPYNHIVIYDTSVIDIDELNVFSETLLSTFEHELTHAVTFNMKNKFWDFISSIFGDAAVPGLLLVNTGMAEGAAVTSESSSGQGRLNDEYARHYVKQAKIEDAFPSFHDVMGAADNSPSGAPYYFNAAFHQWLQDKYGLKSYANFWYQVVNLHHLTINGSFKDVYGISVKKAWKLFQDDYVVPSLPANPVEAGLVRDFFEPEANKYSPENDGAALYQSLTYSKDGLAWIDSKGAKVFYVDKGDVGKSALKAKKIFTHNGLKDVEMSPDGRFMVFSYLSQASASIKSRVKIYDMQTEEFFTVKESGLKAPAIIMHEDNYYLIADKYENHINQTYLAEIELDFEKKVRGLSPIRNLSSGEIIYSQPGHLLSNYKYFSNGQFACIKKEGLSYSLCILDLRGRMLLEYKMPESLTLRSLSVYGDKIYFSWAAPGTMPRIGSLNVLSGHLLLSNRDISGGVYQAVCLGKDLVYTGVFLRQNRLLLLNNDVEKEADEQYLSPLEFDVSLENKISREIDDSEGLESQPFKASSYWKKGVFIPFSSYETSYFGKNAAYTSNISQSLLGLTYISSNPWTDGANDLFVFTTGWNCLNQALGLELKIQKGTDTSLLSGNLDTKLELDKDGIKQIYGQIENTLIYPFGKISYVGLSNTFTTAYGRQDTKNQSLEIYHELFFWDSYYQGIVAPGDDEKAYTISDVLLASYSNIHTLGSNRFEKAGISLALSFGFRKDQSIEDNPVTYVDGCAMAASMRLQLPYLIPIKCKRNLVYNLPSHLDFVLFPPSSIYGYTYADSNAGKIIFDLKSESVVFAFEIQKAIPFFTVLYLNDFYLSAGYAASLGAGNLSKSGFQPAYLPYYIEGVSQGQGFLYDSIYAKLCMELTPNMGTLASSSYKINVFALASIAMHETGRSRFAWTIGSQTSF